MYDLGLIKASVNPGYGMEYTGTGIYGLITSMDFMYTHDTYVYRLSHAHST